MTFVEAVTESPSTQPEPSDPARRADEQRPPVPVDDRPLWKFVAARTWVVAGCALIAAVGALLADGQPTGLGWWDALLRMSMAATFTVAFSKAVPRESRVLGAVSGALGIQALLRFGDFGFFGLPSLVAGAVIVLVLAIGYRNTHRATRRVIRRGISVVAVVALWLLAIAAVAALSVRGDAERGIAAAREGLSAARAGDTVELTARLNEAETRLQKADSRLGGLLVQPMRLAPIVAQQHRAISVAAHQGALVASEAVAAATEADVEELRFQQGQFDLDLLSGMAPRLESTADRLADVSGNIEASRTGWLLPTLDDRLVSLLAEIDDLLPEARLSAEAARVLPAMMGAEQPRRYLMLFGVPGEAREMGGFVGAYALIELDDGNLKLIESGRSPDMLLSATATELDHPDGYPTEFLAADPVRFPQNLTSTPDISVVARAVRDIFPDFGGAPIDGIMYVDPYAIAAMLEFTGPIRIEGSPEPLDGDGVLDFLFEDQYRLFEDRTDRFSAINSVFEATLDGLANSDLPGPERLGEVLGPPARQGRLQVATFDDDENEFLRSVRLQRVFARPIEGDSMALIHANSTASKLDLYLTRDITYAVNVDDDGRLDASVEVTLRSQIPDDAPPYTLAIGDDPTVNLVLLSLYSPHELTSLLVDGRSHQFVRQREYGFNRYALFEVPVAANGSAVVRFELSGRAVPGDYQLAVWHQPLVNNDGLQLEYTGPNDSFATFFLEIGENSLIQPDV